MTRCSPIWLCGRNDCKRCRRIIDRGRRAQQLLDALDRATLPEPDDLTLN